MRGLARSSLAVVAVLLLCAGSALGIWLTPAQAASTGAWRITQKDDPVTGAKLTNISLRSSKIAHSGSIFPPQSQLLFDCRKGQPVVVLVFGFAIGSNKDAEVAYSFDKKPSHVVKAHILRGQQILLLEKKSDVATFMKELAAADLLYLTISSLTKGQTSAVFPVTGAPAVLELVRAGCH